jgi:hypothetical protein
VFSGTNFLLIRKGVELFIDPQASLIRKQACAKQSDN